MLIYGINSEESLMKIIHREMKSCGYFFVSKNENGIYSLDTDRSLRHRVAKSALVYEWENNQLTYLL